MGKVVRKPKPVIESLEFTISFNDLDSNTHRVNFYSVDYNGEGITWP